MVTGYSTGSSSVMMLMVSLLRCVSSEYKVVVLPEPVGPVTISMPSGRAIIRRSVARVSAAKSMRSSGMMERSRSKIRSTMFSPYIVGWVETRKSMGRPERLSEKRPSCAARVSAMLTPLITFKRTAMLGQYVLCKLRTCSSTPSMR